MEKKKRLITLILVVLVLALIFLALLFMRLKPGLFKGEGNFEVVDRYTEANMENISTPVLDGPMIPTPLTEEAIALVSGESKVVSSSVVKAQEYQTIGESVLQAEQVIVVSSNGFFPREIFSIPNKKVHLTFEAIDDGDYQIVFEGNLSFLSSNLNKNTGSVGLFFPGPAVGEYSFYVNSRDNKGVLKSIVE